ncbi:hypothetical protein [Cryobacterium ruanii]|uniref:Uncharacterized protein n=1 Tax=Cryobacterium ruanii TaxID=1259197 RepID=A0A4R9AQ50_9MICO|nr:hypothetical protein [Cryobacterium ruanii]TFD67322.1 hypothetical protein E3T47_05890 [Cryobacterium ruanii]
MGADTNGSLGPAFGGPAFGRPGNVGVGGAGISLLNPPPAGIAASTSQRMRGIRLVLVSIGLLLLAWGTFVMFDSVRLTRIPGVALWIAAAIALHDAILAPIVFAFGIALRRVGRRATGTVIAIIQSGIVVGSIVSLVAVPLIVAKNFAPANATVLPLNYGLNLGLFWVVLALVTVGLSVLAFVRWRQPVEAFPDDSGR